MGIGPAGSIFPMWLEQQAAYKGELLRRREVGAPDNGHTGFNNPERPMKNITPKHDPVVKREAKMISGLIERVSKCK